MGEDSRLSLLPFKSTKVNYLAVGSLKKKTGLQTWFGELNLSKFFVADHKICISQDNQKEIFKCYGAHRELM